MQILYVDKFEKTQGNIYVELDPP